MNTRDFKEKLYSDTYLRLLKSEEQNLSDSPNALRDLIIQVSCEDQDSKDIQNLKSELFEEYFNVIDKENDGNLLPVLTDIDTVQDENRYPIQNKAEISFKIKRSLDELTSHLNNLKIDLPSFSSARNVNKNSVLNTKVSSSSSNNSKSYPCPQFKPCSSMTSNKRSMSESEDTTQEHTMKKPNRFQNNRKPVAQPNKDPPKSSGTGFMSASTMYRNPMKKAQEDQKSAQNSTEGETQGNSHESLKHFDKKIVDVIFNEIMDFSPNIKWSDIAGLEFVKTTVQEIVIWPLLRPDIFQGLRAPPRGILLFGPPGTGKTLIGKCIATESNSTFFCISASSLASKWVGESEQLVRALFTVANLNQPAVIFIDEIDSLLSQRSDKDQDFTRKLKTEFLVQFDGAKTSSESRVLVVGATNRPHELDEAARRRFVKRLYVPLPEESARRQIIEKLLEAHQHNLSDEDLKRICDETKGYSCSDVTHLCKEAAMGPIRSIGPENIKTVSLDQVRPILVNDFLDALRQVRASVAQDDLNYYLEWNKKFGSFGV
ncbi:hypothetical protein JTE90_006670 [Oedothorax gibbosus]|uniref:AAA+ ATPase domain-containing protein n=1 Tax=Oedothorax gibbosus TaxID=931172 RepID=A0AAV6V3P6_9ARAC|nr:hypothetical protein JTE90_006670 [Oedothorax gibbosus]